MKLVRSNWRTYSDRRKPVLIQDAVVAFLDEDITRTNAMVGTLVEMLHGKLSDNEILELLCGDYEWNGTKRIFEHFRLLIDEAKFRKKEKSVINTHLDNDQFKQAIEFVIELLNKKGEKAYFTNQQHEEFLDIKKHLGYS